MKRIILIIMLLVTGITNAQLVVKEAPKDTVIWQATKMSTVPRIVRFTLDTVEFYAIYYKNAEYTHITDIDYIETGDLETTKQFYNLCKQVLVENKEYNVEVDEKMVSIKKGMMGSVMIWTNGSYFYLSEKYIDAILQKLIK